MGHVYLFIAFSVQVKLLGIFWITASEPFGKCLVDRNAFSDMKTYSITFPRYSCASLESRYDVAVSVRTFEQFPVCVLVLKYSVAIPLIYYVT